MDARIAQGMLLPPRAFDRTKCRALAWWSVAKANGQELAEKILGIVTKKMTKEQIVQAKSLSIEISKRIEANRKD